MEPSYKLTYYPIRGSAEAIRLLFAYGGIKYENEHVSPEDWKHLKKDFPFEHLPYLTVNGKIYIQNNSMARFVAKKVNLVGKNSLEDLEIDGIVDICAELGSKIAILNQEQDDTKKKAIKELLLKETIPFYYSRFEELSKKNNGYIACNKLTWADISLVSMLDITETFVGAYLTEYPGLERLKMKVFNIPSIKKWLDIRPETQL